MAFAASVSRLCTMILPVRTRYLEQFERWADSVTYRDASTQVSEGFMQCEECRSKSECPAVSARSNKNRQSCW